ncbi:MAG: hypothetical protein CVT62_08105 [Actinobacteria bacterium HGW-Actinobacteria-2]|nr:MAG: hypothetical protein CVT62_08105 [Actinobacteria bacterium HGW-Actinobacteria-2]
MANKLLRTVGLAAGLTVALTSLTGCDFFNWGSQFAPTPAPTSARPSPSPTPTPTPVVTPTEAESVTATGSLEFNSFPVSEVMTGTCTTGDPLTSTLSDPKNDFYSTVDMTVVIDKTNLELVSVSIITGADSEGGVHKIVYDATAPLAGTSARLTGAGPDYQISGTMADQDSPHGKPVTNLIPVVVKVRCGV